MEKIKIKKQRVMDSHTYYIAPTGSDTEGNGTIASPFKTLKHVSSIIRDNAIIYIRGGSYPSDIIVSHHLDSPNITYIAYNKETPKFFSKNPGEPAISIYANGIILSRVVVDYSIHCGIFVWNCSDITIEHCNIQKCHRGGIYIGSNLSKIQNKNIIIRHNNITNTSLTYNENGISDYTSPAALVLNRALHSTIISNNIYENYGRGIVVCNCIETNVQGNDIRDNMIAGLYIDSSSRLIIEKNYIYNTNNSKKFYIDQIPMSGIFVSNKTRIPFIPNNNITIKNNIFNQYGYGMNFTNEDGQFVLEHLFIAHNTFYNGYKEAIKVVGVVHTKDVRIINNIFDNSNSSSNSGSSNSSNSGIGSNNGGSGNTSSGTTITTSVVNKNITNNKTNSMIATNVNSSCSNTLDDVDTSFLSDIKCYYNGWSTVPTSLGGYGDVISDSKLLSNRSYDNNDKLEKYKLKEESPMRDCGYYLEEVIDDMWGNPRQIPYCLGAHELTTTPYNHYFLDTKYKNQYPSHF